LLHLYLVVATNVFEDNIAILRKHSFIYASAKSTFKMHRLVQLSIQNGSKLLGSRKNGKSVFSEISI
jgi:hypothetical protein